MKILIFLTFVVCNFAQRRNKISWKHVVEIKDRLQKLEEQQQLLTDGQEELSSGQKELEQQQQQLTDGQEELSSGQKELEQQQQLLTDGQEKLSSGQKELEQQQQLLTDGQEKLNSGQEELKQQQQLLTDGQEKLSSGQKELQQKMESIEDKMEDIASKGNWYLGMNINPADGHTFGYTVGWATGNDIGSTKEALTKDYLSAYVWGLPASYIAIVRHQQGVVDAVKVFKFKVLGESLSIRFGLPRMNPGRQIVTFGGPIQESVADDAENLEDDPIFSVGGDLAFNWAYSNNGCRIALTGGNLSEADKNDDNTHGLGNDFACNPLTNTILRDDWSHDISNIQDCPYPECKEMIVQGTDHGRGAHLKTGPVYGNYAIYVSQTAETFPQPGYTLGREIVV